MFFSISIPCFEAPSKQKLKFVKSASLKKSEKHFDTLVQ